MFLKYEKLHLPNSDASDRRGNVQFERLSYLYSQHGEGGRTKCIPGDARLFNPPIFNYNNDILCLHLSSMCCIVKMVNSINTSYLPMLMLNK